MRVAIIALTASLAVLATDTKALGDLIEKIPAGPEKVAAQAAFAKVIADLGNIDIDMHPDRKPAALANVTVPKSVAEATANVRAAKPEAVTPAVAVGVSAAGANELGRMPVGVDPSGGNIAAVAKEQDDATKRKGPPPVEKAHTKTAAAAVAASAALAKPPVKK